MAEALPKMKLTYEDYCRTPDDERWELLNGELVAMAPSPTLAHQRVAFNLAFQLRTFVDRMGIGEVFVAPLDVVLSGTNVVQPDVLFVSNERQHISTPANIRGTPDLVVEVLSPSTTSRDWRTKLDIYNEHGVREYWVADPEAQRVWVLTRGDGELKEVGNYGKGDTLISPLLEGFSADLDEVFPAHG
jgi:Uma2 family endonuclease